MAEVRIGCSSWTSPAWTGRFYPPGIADTDRLPFYARWFDTVEVDSTYYRPPSPFVVRSWDKRTPEGFRFTFKMTRDLLDPKKRVKEKAAAEFVETVQLVGPKLAAVLLQFPPWFKAPRSPGTGNAAFLEQRLAELPKYVPYAVELRDAGWFSGENRTWLERTLSARGATSCWSCLTYVAIPPIRTADWVYLRFIGDHEAIPEALHGEIRVDRSKEMDYWAGQLRASEVRSAMAFFNNHFQGYAPESASRFRQTLGLGTQPLPPVQPTLG